MEKRYLCIFFIGLLTNGLMAQPLADFLASDTWGCTPLTVTFTNLSTGDNALTYLWDFGDGNTISTMDNSPVVHTYTIGGDYTICLTATDVVTGLSDTECKTDLLTVYGPITNLFFDICEGDIVLVNDSIYNAAGFYQQILPNQGLGACDSVINININTFPIANHIIANELCIDDSIVVNGTAYFVDNPMGTELLPGASVNGCDSMIIIDLMFQQVDTVTLPPQLLCEGDSIVINGITYNVNNTSGTEVLTNQAGCDSLVVEISVTILETPTIAQVITVDGDCEGSNNGSISLSVTGGAGGYIYLWSDQVTPTNDPNRSDLAAGDYEVIVTDAFGCTTSRQVTVSEPSPILIAVDTILPITCLSPTVGINPTVTGGTPPYLYEWSNGLSDLPSIVVNQAGLYELTVTDANFCTAAALFTVVEAVGLPQVAASLIQPCQGSANGSIDLTIIDVCSPYTVLWDNGLSSLNITGLAADDYSLTITDCSGCVFVANYTLDEYIISGTIDLAGLPCQGEE
ncbi:MAG: PKD domain-containing protein, partial [Bacteroidota bacterium]